VAERRKQWRFLLAEDGTWRWEAIHPDGTESASARSFSTLKDCTADATQNGYIVCKPEEERRRAQK
jgi:hypothetical protein